MLASRTSSSRFRSPSIAIVLPSMVKVGWVTWFIWLYPFNRVYLAGCCARTALDAQFRIDVVRLLLFSGNGLSWAGLDAQTASLALHLVDLRPQQRLAPARKIGRASCTESSSIS